MEAVKMSTNMYYIWETGVLDSSTLKKKKSAIKVKVREVQSSDQKGIQVSRTWEPGMCHTHPYPSGIPLVTIYSGNIAHYSN